MDFSKWQDEAEFARKFGKLIEGLDLFYKEKQAIADAGEPGR